MTHIYQIVFIDNFSQNNLSKYHLSEYEGKKIYQLENKVMEAKN